MGKRWTEEDEAIVALHYPTAKSVDEVARMVGRGRHGVIKKALEMGLNRPDLHETSVQRLREVLSDVPLSSGDIAERLGMTRSATCDLLRRSHDEGICHIAEYRSNNGRGKDAPMWVLGDGANALEDCAIEKAEREARIAAQRKIPFKPFRDPFIAIFYGEYREAA